MSDSPDDPGLHVPYLLRDRLYLRRMDAPPTGEEVLLASPVGYLFVRDEGPYGDGPVAARVAVVDVDATTGRARTGARLVRSARRRRPWYDVDPAALDPDAPVEAFESDAFIQVSAFATVLRTLRFFERPDLLGRRIEWAFPGPIDVVPRVGEDAQACYDRSSRSLRFGSYPGPDGAPRYTVLSADVVGHETAHAVLDGIAPDLYDAITPQSLALHEAIADLAAICLNLLDETIVFSLVAISGGLLDVPTVLSRVAEEFGSDQRGAGRGDYLRAARNVVSLLDVDRDAPHDVGEVLSGALYQVFLRVSEGLGSGPDDLERQIHAGGHRLARLVFPALDHLPPGEASFVDLARAIVARARVEHTGHPDADWLIEELVARHVIASPAVVDDVPADFEAAELDGVDLDALATDDDTARRFAEDRRAFLGIPRRVPFEVLPRHVAHRRATVGGRRRGTGELVVRVRWLTTEEHDLGPEFAHRWSVPMGTTMVVDRARRRVLSLLTTDPSDEQVADRDLLLQRWVDEGVLRPDGEDDESSPTALRAVTRRSRQRVTGGARLLHPS